MSRLFKVLILLVVLIGVCFVVLWGYLPSIISRELTGKAGVPVHVGAIYFTPSKIGVDDLVIMNPPKSVTKKALSIQETKIMAPLTNYLKSDIYIDEITIDDMFLSIEFDKKGSPNGNWATIMGNLKSRTSSGGKQRRVFIKRVVLTNVNAVLAYRNERGRVKKLSTIKHLELKNISSEGGIPSSQIMHIILQESLKSIFSLEGLQNLMQDVIAPPEQNILNPFNLFGDARE